MIGQPITLWRWLLRFPWHLLLLSLALVTVGSLALYSASEGSWSPWAGRHAVRGAVGVGIVLMLASHRSAPAAEMVLSHLAGVNRYAGSVDDC